MRCRPQWLPPVADLGIAVIQFADSYTKGSNATGTTVGPILDLLGIPYTDVTAALEADALDYQDYSFVVIDSFATARAAIRTALDADAAEIQAFVNGGGVAMMMAQANQDLNGGITSPDGGPAGPVNWAPATMKYSDIDGEVFRVDPGHAVWTDPNAADPNDMGLLPCWEGLAEWDPAYQIHGYRCTDATCVASDPTVAAFAELTWGDGAFLFSAMPADVSSHSRLALQHSAESRRTGCSPGAAGKLDHLRPELGRSGCATFCPQPPSWCGCSTASHRPTPIGTSTSTSTAGTVWIRGRRKATRLT